MLKNIQTTLLGFFLSMLAFGAQAAAPDVTGLNTDIAAVGTAIASVIAALMAMSVLLFGATKVYAFIKRKAGA